MGEWIGRAGILYRALRNRHAPAVALALVVFATFAASPGAELIHNGAFDPVAAGQGSWEFRYGIKMSEPDSRPRWRPVPDDDRGSSDHGPHLVLRQYGPAAGSVYVGQRVRLPKPAQLLDLTVDYQTFCPMSNRSGQLAFFIYSPEKWERLGADPEGAGEPLGADILEQVFHPNGEDVTRWQTAACDPLALSKALSQYAGREVVVGVSFLTWHPSSDEWMRLDNFHLGAPRARIQPLAWPDYAFRGEPLPLTAVASVPEGATVRFLYRSVGFANDAWRQAPGGETAGGRYVGQIPAEAMAAPLEVRATLSVPNEKERTTKVHRIELTERPAHPNVFYTKAELEEMRKKIERFDWAKQRLQSVKRSADAAMKKTDETPPPRGGGWSHDYTCPDDGARLKFREDKPHAHLCPVCKKEWTDEKRDATWRSYMHGRFSGRAGYCAMAYQITGDEKYACEAIRILTWYADHYAGFELGKGPAGRGKVHSQSLTEASWLTGIIEAADLAYPAMTTEQARHIETDLVRAAAEHVANYRDRFRIHNIACWHNAAMACAGYFLGDPGLVRRATEGEYGFKQQIAKGILPDGMWYERSLGYHNYTADALIRHATAAMHAGDDLHTLGRFREMLTLPLRLAFPNLSTPSFNDMGYATKPIGTRNLEIAVAWFGDETAESALSRLVQKGASRANDTAWQWGRALPDALDFQLPPSANLEGTGVAVLRSATGEDALCAMIEYGEHGGGHGHPDKLQVIFYGLHEQLLPDMGTVGYGNPMHAGWFKTTPSHNTVTIGGRNMANITGKCEGFEANDRYAAAVASAHTAYKGWRLTRRILLVDRFLIDDFTIDGSSPEILDWFTRAPGDLEVGVELEPDTERPLSKPYGYLKELRTGKTDGDWTAVWRQGKGADAPRLALTMHGAPGTIVSRAKAPAPKGARWDNLRVRRRARQARFTCVYQVLPQGAAPQDVRFAGATIAVGEREIVVPVDPAGILSLR